MPEVRISSNAKAIAQSLRAAPQRTTSQLRTVAQKNAYQLRRAIMQNARGRPGPRMVTGDYYGSWTSKGASGALPAAIIGTTAPQANRLEYGFRGTDRLGRRYNQSSYPHVHPAMLTRLPIFVRDVQRVINEVARDAGMKPGNVGGEIVR